MCLFEQQQASQMCFLHSLQWELWALIRGPSKWMFLVLCRMYPCAGGEALGWGLSFEVSLDDDGSDTDLTRAQKRSEGCVKSSRRIWVADRALKCKRSLACYCLIDRQWLGAYFLLYLGDEQMTVDNLSCVFECGTALLKSRIYLDCQNPSTQTPTSPSTDSLSQARQGQA